MYIFLMLGLIYYSWILNVKQKNMIMSWLLGRTDNTKFGSQKTILFTSQS